MNDRSRARRWIELYRVYKLPVFLRPRDDDGGRQADERSGAESIVSDGSWDCGESGGGGEPQGPVCARSVYAAAAVDVISEFDSLSALPDLRQISQSE